MVFTPNYYAKRRSAIHSATLYFLLIGNGCPGQIKESTDQIERNLDQAQNSIEMLEVIKNKTAGNLSPQQSRMLESILTDLRLNFVDEKKKDTLPQ